MIEQFPTNKQTNQVEQEPTINDVEVFAAQTIQKDRVMGAVDSEGDDYSNIVQQVKDGKLSPQEGINRIQGMSDSRQDYH
jgi:hypothetical protein